MGDSIDTDIKEKEKIDQMDGSCGPAAVAGCWPGSCLISSLLRLTEALAAAEHLWDLDPSAVGQTRDHLEVVRLGQGAGRPLVQGALNCGPQSGPNDYAYAAEDDNGADGSLDYEADDLQAGGLGSCAMPGCCALYVCCAVLGAVLSV